MNFNNTDKPWNLQRVSINWYKPFRNHEAMKNALNCVLIAEQLRSPFALLLKFCSILKNGIDHSDEIVHEIIRKNKIGCWCNYATVNSVPSTSTEWKENMKCQKQAQNHDIAFYKTVTFVWISLCLNHPKFKNQVCFASRTLHRQKINNVFKEIG